MNITIEEEKHSLKQLIAEYLRKEGFIQRIVEDTIDGVYENFRELDCDYEASKLVDLIYLEPKSEEHVCEDII